MIKVEHEAQKIKNFYSNFADHIIDKRLKSKHKLRRYVHQKQYESILNFVEPEIRVLDAGCGEGVLAVLMAKKGAIVTACDISQPNIEKSKIYAREEGVDDRIDFLVADSENLPFKDNSFDLVVSSHVLEHLPNFDKGLNEIMRITKKRSVVAIPTILNLCSFVQIGGSTFWLKRKKSLPALFWGALKTLLALVSFQEGVNEFYAGHNVPHIFRFPWIMKKKAKKFGFNIVNYEASSLCLPFFESLFAVSKILDKYKNRKFFRNFGYGTTYVLEK